MSVNYFSHDTIAAVATSLAGDGGIGIIRISGPEALLAAQEITSGFENPKPRFVHRVRVHHPKTKETLDDGVAIYFKNHESFTGEEVVELQLHGGRFLLQMILRALIENGKCRVALPGEFSFRAVQNEKMDINTAQSIKQIIEAKSLFEVQATQRRVSAERLKEFFDVANALHELIALTELSIDFSDQEVEVVNVRDAQKKIEKIREAIEGLLKKAAQARKIAGGIKVTLAGEPNAGKSTIFNMILSQDRAIVSEEAGTTRDIITEEIQIDPYYIQLSDTAGIRESISAIEQKGIEKAHELFSNSDLVLYVLNAEKELPALLDTVERVKKFFMNTVFILNKCDLAKENTKKELSKHEAVLVTASKNIGALEIISKIKENLELRFLSSEDVVLPTEIQMQMLKRCSKEVEEAAEFLKTQSLYNPEILSSTLRSAATALSDFVGQTTPDTILTKIFSEFCIGK